MRRYLILIEPVAAARYIGGLCGGRRLTLGTTVRLAC